MRPRIEALRSFAPRFEEPHQPVTVDGYTFSAFERIPEGKVFYTLELGGPFSSLGIFVPNAGDRRSFGTPATGLPGLAASVTPTSVPGLYWLVTRD